MDHVERRPPIWWRPERGSRGPSPALDRQAIAAAAVALADVDGLAAVSMRAVASRLGTSASALYRYVDDRSDLLDLMADRVVTELRPYVAPRPDWLEQLLGLAAKQRALHARHSWLIALGHRSSRIGPEALAFFDHCLDVLTPTQAPARTKFEVIALMTGLAALFARHAPAGQPDATPALPLSQLAAYPRIADALGHPGVAPVDGDLFERAVRGLLLGLLVPADHEPTAG